MNNENFQAAMNAPIQHNSDNSDQELIVMFEHPWQWIADIFYTAVYVVGAIALGALVAVFLAIATGLHTTLF